MPTGVETDQDISHIESPEVLKNHIVCFITEQVDKLDDLRARLKQESEIFPAVIAQTLERVGQDDAQMGKDLAVGIESGLRAGADSIPSRFLSKDTFADQVAFQIARLACVMEGCLLETQELMPAVAQVTDQAQVHVEQVVSVPDAESSLGKSFPWWLTGGAIGLALGMGAVMVFGKTK